MDRGAPPDDAARASPQVRLDRWVALVLTVAGLLSAWASFQDGMWSGREAECFHRSNAGLARSNALATRAGQQEITQLGLFMSWLAAVADGQEKQALFLEQQFVPPFDAEFQRWRSSLPEDLRTADDYRHRPKFIGLLSGPADEARGESTADLEQANQSGSVADRYSRWNTLLATALFLAGMATVVHSRRGQKMMIGLAAALTASSMLALLLLPKSFGG